MTKCGIYTITNIESGRIHSEQSRRNMADAQVRKQRRAADAGPAMESV